MSSAIIPADPQTLRGEPLSPAQLRALMPALANKTYFNYGGQGPLPSPSLAAITESWQRIQELGPFTGSIWPWLAAQTQGLRADLAVICGVPPPSAGAYRKCVQWLRAAALGFALAGRR